MHNAFKNCIEALKEEHALELAYHLHNWFKDKPCKIEDFEILSRCVIMADESLFLWHISTSWLTISSVLVDILEQWNEANVNFLKYLPKTRGMPTFFWIQTRNARKSSSVFGANEKTTLIEINFMNSVAQPFEKYF